MNFFKNLSQSIRKLNHRRIDFLRSLRLKVFTELFNQKNAFKGHLSVGAPRVLILRLDGKLGDTITITGLLKELRQQGFKIDIVTRESQSFIYDFITTEHRLFKVVGALSLCKIFFQLRKNKYAHLICTTHLLDPSSLFLARFLRAKNKIVLLNQNLRFFDKHLVENFDSIHITERYQQILKFMGLPTSALTSQYFLKIDDLALLQVKKEIKDQGFEGKPFIVVNSFAGSRDRNLSYDLTVQLINELLKTFSGHHVVSLGSAHDLETLRQWQKKSPSQRWHLLGNGDFSFNAAILRLCDLVISPDTAVIHLASATQRPVVGIYRVGGAREEFPYAWAPNLPKSQYDIIYAFNGSIETIQVADVVNSAKKILIP